MEEVLRFLDSIAPLEDDLRSYLYSIIRTTRPRKNTILLQEESVARNISFIEKGVVRGITTDDDDREVTPWIMTEGDVFISIQSFLTQTPTLETVQTMEPCIIHSITYEQFRYAHKTYRNFDRIRGDLLEKYYLLSEERNKMRQRKDIYVRVCFLMENYPHLVDRVADKVLASFIATTPEYFSKKKDEYLRKHGRR